MKKIYIIIPIIIVITTIIYFNYNSNDSTKFKKEYEQINGKETEDGKKTRSIKIPKNNKIVYKTEDDIVNMINNKETFVVYFGFAKCPWCRSVVPTLLEVVKDRNIDKIYYVDIENIRDKIEVDNNKLIKTTKGTTGYNKLVKLLNPVLSKYTVTDKNGIELDTKEKRIYAPNVVVVVNGKPKKLETGISEKLTDPYMKLTKEIKKDTYNKFDCILKCISQNNTCNKNMCVK